MGILDTVLQVGGQLLGGFIGSQGAKKGGETAAEGAIEGARISAASAEKQAAQNIALQREFARHGIGMRVADALESGVHPLFALGASTAQFSPNPIVVNDGGYAEAGRARGEAQARIGSEMGAAIGRAAAAFETDQQRELREAQLAVLRSEAERNEANAMHYYALAGAAMQPEWGRYSPFSGQGSAAGIAGQKVGSIQYQPAKIPSREKGRPEQVAGDRPFWIKYEVKPGRFIDIPYNEDEPTEGLEFKFWPSIMSHNINKYGLRSFAEAVEDFIPGATPLRNFGRWARKEVNTLMREQRNRARPGLSGGSGGGW